MTFILLVSKQRELVSSCSVTHRQVQKFRFSKDVSSLFLFEKLLVAFLHLGI